MSLPPRMLDAIRTAFAFCLIVYRVIDEHNKSSMAMAVEALTEEQVDQEKLRILSERIGKSLDEAGLLELVDEYFRDPESALSFTVAVSGVWIGLLHFGWDEFRRPAIEVLEDLVQKLAVQEPGPTEGGD